MKKVRKSLFVRMITKNPNAPNAEKIVERLQEKGRDEFIGGLAFDRFLRYNKIMVSYTQSGARISPVAPVSFSSVAEVIDVAPRSKYMVLEINLINGLFDYFFPGDAKDEMVRLFGVNKDVIAGAVNAALGGSVQSVEFITSFERFMAKRLIHIVRSNVAKQKAPFDVATIGEPPRSIQAKIRYGILESLAKTSRLYSEPNHCVLFDGQRVLVMRKNARAIVRATNATMQFEGVAIA